MFLTPNASPDRDCAEIRPPLPQSLCLLPTIRPEMYAYSASGNVVCCPVGDFAILRNLIVGSGASRDYE